jgi:glycosyltransferase involved in cell wall biosynthesis
MAALSESPSIRCVHAIDLDESEMASAYQSADILLTFGREEGLPRVVLEAMSCGCAVVGYDGGGGREFMHHGRSALVAREAGDVVRLARELMADPRLKERIREGGHKEATRYTLPAQRDALASALALLRAARARGTLSLEHPLREICR